MLQMRWCAGCQDERGFEVPSCEDGHGVDCLDLACVECGHAIVVGHLVAEDLVAQDLVVEGLVVVEFAAA